MTDSDRILQLVRELKHVYRRRWWQFWRLKITDQQMVEALGQALIGDRDPLTSLSSDDD
jgi:hypothetical protein